MSWEEEGAEYKQGNTEKAGLFGEMYRNVYVERNVYAGACIKNMCECLFDFE